MVMISGLSMKITSLSTEITHCSTITRSLSTKITHCSTPLRKSRFFCRILSDIRLPFAKIPDFIGIFCRKYIHIVKKKLIPNTYDTYNA